MKISLDWETASELSLPKVGAHVYAAHPSTRILCLGWALDDEDPEIWFPERGPMPARLLAAIIIGAELHAWNAAFEQAVWYALRARYNLPAVTRNRWHCTMARAAFWGLPLKLEQAAAALRLNLGKDMEGHKLMLRMSRPRSCDADGTLHWWDREEPERLERLGRYCQQDVTVERAIGRLLPELPERERRIWLLDQRMNNRGLRHDSLAASALTDAMQQETRRLAAKLSDLTRGAVTRTTQAARMLAFLHGIGLDTPDLRRDTVTALLARTDLTLWERELLLTYRQGAKASNAKLAAMARYCCQDGRIRGLVQYGGAIRTLRWAGRGPQIQNYPRPVKGLDTVAATEDIITGLRGSGISTKYGLTPLVVISAALRGCFIPAPGKRFAVCDYSSIEARVIAWLAGQADVLEVFARGEDVYSYAAKRVGSEDRLLGKVLTLACGFGMGWLKFIATALSYGIVLSEEEAKKHVHAWRQANAKIMEFWYACDKAFREVIFSRTTEAVRVGHLSFRMAKPGSRLAGCLLLRLPSGRHIVYREPKLVTVLHKDEETGEKWSEELITYMGHNLAKQWVRIKTWGGKIAENATQAIARDLLAEALLRLDDLGLPLDTTIHDEIIAEPEAEAAERTLRIMKREMTVTPAWALGVPLAAEGHILTRYGKA